MSSEAVVQQQVRLAMARLGGQVWRNQSGAMEDKTGRIVRFGLSNDSAALNAAIKSADLIGITPMTVQPHHVGRTVGVFTALEVKRPGWHLTLGDKRGQAQKRFLDIVVGVGGMAGFVTDPADLANILVL